MAVPNTLIVSNAGYNPANGTYIRGADSGGYPTWSNENNHVIRIDNDGPGFKIWKLKNDTGQNLYSNIGFNFASATWPGEYPADPNADPAIVWQVSVPFGVEPVPVFSLTPPVPDPYAPWGGLQNWLRLRLLEYV